MSRGIAESPITARNRADDVHDEPPVEIVQLTPPGRGAVATLRIEGPGIFNLLRGLFRPRGRTALELRPVGQIVVGRFGNHPGEVIVACRCGDGSVELHCHGGPMAAETIRAALVTAGARHVAWQEWVAGQHSDPIAAAARLALAEARTERTAAILLDQYHGALRRAMDQIEQALSHHDTAAATAQIETLLARAELGRHLTRSWQVVLAGPENAGKSSLVNALVGYPRAIVHHVPGTTRDVLCTTTAIDGWPIEFCDTAGLVEIDGSSADLGHDAARQSLRRAGVERARQQLASADLVVAVFDASRPWRRPIRQCSTPGPTPWWFTTSPISQWPAAAGRRGYGPVP